MWTCLKWICLKWICLKWICLKWICLKWICLNWICPKWTYLKSLSPKWICLKWICPKWICLKWFCLKWIFPEGICLSPVKFAGIGPQHCSEPFFLSYRRDTSMCLIKGFGCLCSCLWGFSTGTPRAEAIDSGQSLCLMIGTVPDPSPFRRFLHWAALNWDSSFLLWHSLFSLLCLSFLLGSCSTGWALFDLLADVHLLLKGILQESHLFFWEVHGPLACFCSQLLNTRTSLGLFDLAFLLSISQSLMQKGQWLFTCVWDPLLQLPLTTGSNLDHWKLFWRSFLSTQNSLKNSQSLLLLTLDSVCLLLMSHIGNQGHTAWRGSRPWWLSWLLHLQLQLS